MTKTITVGPEGGVQQISDGATTWTYVGLSPDPGLTAFAVYADVNKMLWSYTIDPQQGRVVGESKPSGAYQYEMMLPGPRLRRVIAAEGDYTEYGYDARGNVTSVKKYSKTGVLGHETTIAYPATCTPTTRATCNKPLYMLEGSTNGVGGARTDFEYETHGAVKSVTRPPGANSVRPKTSYSYQQRSAHYHQGSGLADGPPVWRLTSVSTCMTLAPCGGTPDETKTNYAYGTPGTPNNLRVSSITERAGDDSVLAKTSFSYNIYGDVRTVDGPLAGTVDMVRNRYNFERELVGQVGPDPDGAGPRLPSATRYNLRPDGRIESVDIGTVADQGDTAWYNFNLIERESYVYDVAGRLVSTTRTGGGVTHSLVQVSYDGAGRTECTAVRMNPAAFGSPPASACTLGTEGSDGPDRITRNSYNSLSQLARVTEALGTGAQRDAVTTTYTPNAKVQTVADGKGNLTTYEYDSFDRLSRTRYPDPGNVGSSSSSDYEELTYHPTWEVVQHRRRNGQVESFTYDQRGNLLSNSLPTTTTYTYDNLDRVRTASAGGETITDAYDALSRLTSSTIGGATVAYQYDDAGRRTRLTWPDGFYVTYDLDHTGAVTAIRQSGSTLLAGFTYDLLGRRQTLDRGNSISTTYGYDGASRLTSLAHGGSVNQTLTLGYNPASQIKSRTGSNAQFNFTGLQALDHTYVNNGLNQVTAVGPQTITHNANGNLQSDGVSTYTHDADNRLTGVSGGASLAYDPIGRLRQITAAGVSTRFIYDGVDLIAELDGAGGVLHRYVHGPNIDEPLVWYEGAGTSGSARRWLHADHQGSIIAATGNGGLTRSRNTYDEYGVPGASNEGRFQYTGQVRIPEIDLYYYKSRFYSARYGRFLEPDPVGYEDGLNPYAYVGNDPVNRIDPMGLSYTVVGELEVSGCAPINGCYTSFEAELWTPAYEFQPPTAGGRVLWRGGKREWERECVPLPGPHRF
ncbi:MAG: RHS repeat-associated core domain-containing protein [Phenylobacterium sp.]